MQVRPRSRMHTVQTAHDSPEHKTQRRREYARDYAARVLGDVGLAAGLNDEVLDRIFWTLSRQNEVSEARRDKYGNWQVGFDEVYADGRFCRPWLDDVVRFFGNSMTTADMIRRIHAAGWEIGLHGSYHSATRSGVLAGQVRALAEVIRAPVISTRQHHLSYEAATTPGLQESGRLKVDSTIGWNRTAGYRSGPCVPYRVWNYKTAAPAKIIEVPMQVMDVSLSRSEYMGLSLERAVESVIPLMDDVCRIGGCLTLNWHPEYTLNESYWAAYALIPEEAQRRDPWGATMADVGRVSSTVNDN